MRGNVQGKVSEKEGKTPSGDEDGLAISFYLGGPRPDSTRGSAILNTVRLSGTLVTHPELGQTESGASIAKARLQFNEKDNPISIFCVSEQADQLSKFQRGEKIFVVGRLVIRGDSRNAAIAADKVEPAVPHAPDARADIEFFQTMRAHGRNARLPGG
jgi:hypothetical protein